MELEARGIGIGGVDTVCTSPGRQMRLPEGVGIVFDVATGALDGRRRRLGDSVWPLGDGRRGSCANSTFRIRRTRSRQRRSVGRPRPRI